MAYQLATTQIHLKGTEVFFLFFVFFSLFLFFFSSLFSLSKTIFHCIFQVVPIFLADVLDGKDRRDYVERVEPSELGGQKMAHHILTEMGLIDVGTV